MILSEIFETGYRKDGVHVDVLRRSLAEDRVQRMSQWQPYKGPQGGTGWQHSGTGEVRYQKDRPEERADGDQEGGQPWQPTSADGLFNADKIVPLHEKTKEAFAPRTWSLHAFKNKRQYPEEEKFSTNDPSVINKVRVARQLTDRLVTDRKFRNWAAEEVSPFMKTHFVAGKKLDNPSHEMRRVVRLAVQELIDTWAVTSSDSKVSSMGLQKAAIEEFGVPDDAFNAAMDKAHDKSRGSFTRKFDENWERSSYAYKAFLRAMYQNTQARLKELDLKQLVLFRGMRFDSIDVLKNRHDVSDHEFEFGNYNVMHVTSNPLSSWSSDLETADGFARRRNKVAVIVAAVVPAERVLSFPETGLGATHEYEFVVMGGRGQAAVFSPKLFDKDLWQRKLIIPEKIESPYKPLQLKPKKKTLRSGKTVWTYDRQGRLLTDFPKLLRGPLMKWHQSEPEPLTLYETDHEGITKQFPQLAISNKPIPFWKEEDKGEMKVHPFNSPGRHWSDYWTNKETGEVMTDSEYFAALEDDYPFPWESGVVDD